MVDLGLIHCAATATARCYCYCYCALLHGLSLIRIQGQLTTTQILQLTATQRMKLKNRINRKWEDETVQQSIVEMDFKIIEDTQNHKPPTAVTRKQDITTIIHEANNKVTWK